MSRAWITVVAGALRRADGCWLMHQRPTGKHHAGLWEFPGGKVEPDEKPKESLLRELSEELGIRCHAEACEPTGFAEGAVGAGGEGIVILLYIVTRWEGEPTALEGGAVGWFTPAEAVNLPMPPLDIELAGRLFQNR